jgi:voltage-gated potassium channel
VACTDSDNENVVITLTARQINPKIRIVSRVDDIDHETKIRKVGADAVVSPNFIGGLRMASELIRPTVVDFLDTMLRDREMNLRIDEIRIPDSSPAVGVQLKDMGFEKTPDVLLLAVRQVNGEWTYNPLRSDVVAANTVLIFLGTPKDSRALCDHLGGEMISPPARGG